MRESHLRQQTEIIELLESEGVDVSGAKLEEFGGEHGPGEPSAKLNLVIRLSTEDNQENNRFRIK